MEKNLKSKIKLYIHPGSANPSPPIGPALGQYGINILDFCKEFNFKSKLLDKDNLLSVEVFIFSDRSFTFNIKSPPTSFLIKKFAIFKKKLIKNEDKCIGLINFSKIVEIAKIKSDDLTGSNLEKNVSSIIGTAKSMNIKVEK
ncbi:MAG: 50S ribosomal protein L11 [Enterobacteriaceae bacterium]